MYASLDLYSSRENKLQFSELLKKEKFFKSHGENTVSRILPHTWYLTRQYFGNGLPVLPRVSCSYPLQPFPFPLVYLLMSVVVDAAIMLQHEPPFPPTVHEPRLSPLI